MYLDETEHNLMRQLIAARSVRPERTFEIENRLYEYQLKIGSAAAYFSYERTHTTRLLSGS